MKEGCLMRIILFPIHMFYNCVDKLTDLYEWLEDWYDNDSEDDGT